MKLDYQISAGAVAIAFDAVPPESVRTALKAQGFRFDGRAWHRRKVAGSAELVRWIRAELDKVGQAAPDVVAPPLPPIAPPSLPAATETRRPTMAAIVGQAIAEDAPPLAPAPKPEQAPPMAPPQTRHLPPPRRGLSVRQLPIFDNQPATDVESYSPIISGEGAERMELRDLTERAQLLAKELSTLIYITRDLATGDYHLRRADCERNEHENLQCVVFPNGRYSD